MAIPSFLKGESIVRLLQGGALGAVAAMILGFNWGGWTLGSTAEQTADNQSKAAVVTALAPICVEQFKASVDNVANLATLTQRLLTNVQVSLKMVAGRYCREMTNQVLVLPKNVQNSLLSPEFDCGKRKVKSAYFSTAPKALASALNIDNNRYQSAAVTPAQALFAWMGFPNSNWTSILSRDNKSYQQKHLPLIGTR